MTHARPEKLKRHRRAKAPVLEVSHPTWRYSLLYTLVLAGCGMIIVALLFGGLALASSGSFGSIHRGDTRTQVNQKLGEHGKKLWGYSEHGLKHRVRRYHTSTPHRYIVIDYAVRPHHLRVFFKTRCTWSPDGAACSPGATH